MTNPTCPICQASQEATDAQLKGDKIIILLTCANGHKREVEVPVSRFIRKSNDCEADPNYSQRKLDELRQSYDLAIERIESFHKERAKMVKELDAYAAYVACKITLKELEEITSA